MNAILELLHTARVVRKQLKASLLYSGASIRDAVELAADNLRSLATEAEADRSYAAWADRHFAV